MKMLAAWSCLMKSITKTVDEYLLKHFMLLLIFLADVHHAEKFQICSFHWGRQMQSALFHSSYIGFQGLSSHNSKQNFIRNVHRDVSFHCGSTTHFCCVCLHVQTVRDPHSFYQNKAKYLSSVSRFGAPKHVYWQSNNCLEHRDQQWKKGLWCREVSMNLLMLLFSRFFFPLSAVTVTHHWNQW